MPTSPPTTETSINSPGRYTKAGASFVAIAVALSLGALLSSSRIVSMAERKQLGPERDRWLAVAEPIDSFASAARLDTPQSVVDGWLGRSTTTNQPVVTTTLPPSTTTSAPASTTSTTEVTSTSLAPSTTQATATTTSPRRSISPQDPLIVLAAGDSLGEYIGQELKIIADDADLGDVMLDFNIATGLTRPDYFDWPSHLNEGLTGEVAVDVVLFMAGGNDDQPMSLEGERLPTLSPEWVEEYRRRSGALMDIAESNGTYIIWIGLPPMEDERREGISVEINRVVAEEAAVRAQSSYFDPAPLLLEGDETYSLYATSPDGERRKARAPDGVHITRVASRWIAQDIWDLMVSDWPQADPTTTTTP